MSDTIEVKTVAHGGKFCDCGGLMVVNNDRKMLLSDPPQVNIYCPFCNYADYALSPYNVLISFKKVDAVEDKL